MSCQARARLKPSWALQEGPGRYSAAAWEALDRVLDLARAAGLKVMVSLLDNWKYNGARSRCPYPTLALNSWRSATARGAARPPAPCAEPAGCGQRGMRRRQQALLRLAGTL
jgi:hypothetical protein